MINEDYQGKIKTHYKERAILYNDEYIDIGEFKNIKNNKEYKRQREFFYYIQEIRNKISPTNLNNGYLEEGLPKEKNEDFSQIKNLYFIMIMLIFNHYQDDKWIEITIKQYITNKLLSNLPQISDKGKKNLHNKELGISLEDLNIIDEEREYILKKYENFTLSKDEFYNIYSLEKIDKEYFDGIIDRKEIIQLILSKRGNNNGNKK